jgi:hypothetical protein
VEICFSEANDIQIPEVKEFGVEAGYGSERWRGIEREWRWWQQEHTTFVLCRVSVILLEDLLVYITVNTSGTLLTYWYRWRTWTVGCH